MNWFWLKSQDRKRSPDQRNVTVTEPEAVSVPLVSDAEVRAAEDERRMQIVRDCVEYGRRHYEALPTVFTAKPSGRCPKCTKEKVRVELVTLPDAHSDECTRTPVGSVHRNMLRFERLHDEVEREYLRVSCSTCGHDRGLVLPADAEVDQ